MSKHTFFTALGAAALSLFAISLAQAGEMSSHKHTSKAAATRHISAGHASVGTWRHSYARMPVESEAPQLYLMPSSPNLFETGRPPAQPGPAH
jgi:hypothetical protein